MITIFRILLIAPFCYALVEYGLLYTRTLVLLMLIGLTDFLDGFIARLQKQETEIGKVLDPLADFILVFSVMLTMIIYLQLPYWLLIIYLLRTLLLVLQLGFYYYKVGSTIELQSRMLGKITFVLITTYY